MDVQLIAGIAGLVGLAIGLAASLAVRASERAQHSPSPQPTSGIPPGIAAMLTALPSAAIVLDSSERVLRSSAAARAFGLVQADRLVVSELVQLARQVRRDEEVREAEIEIPRERERFGQDTATFSVRVAPLGVDLVLVSALDQSELRRVEAVRRDFVANVSHELKTPVGALALLAETTEDAADDPEAVRRFAGRMQHEANRLTTLVQELITLSRLQGGDPVPEPQPVALDDVVAEAVDRCRLSADAKDIALATSGENGISVTGDEELLVTALRNLVDNAIAYSPEHTRVVVAVRGDGEHVDLSVTDQGMGIAEHDRERIFERFYRVDPARSRATGGTGLGLAIVKHVATNHGGAVKTWSKEKLGSTFTITLPVRDSDRAREAEARDELGHEANPDPGNEPDHDQRGPGGSRYERRREATS